MGIDGIVDGHGVGIALTGMSVVFAGLVLVSLYIRVLPAAFERAARGTPVPPRPAVTTGGDTGITPELLAVFAYVLQAEHERELLSDDQRITIREDDDEQRVWTAIGKMRSLATRL
jgi:Na+-transporting methylmalonyl-CoA/oxaloacetate decarboxylase gamma subunit